MSRAQIVIQGEEGSNSHAAAQQLFGPQVALKCCSSFSEALAALAQAVEKGYRNRELTRAEPCFSHLRDEPEFEALVAKMVPKAKAAP